MALATSLRSAFVVFFHRFAASAAAASSFFRIHPLFTIRTHLPPVNTPGFQDAQDSPQKLFSICVRTLLLKRPHAYRLVL